MKTFTRDSTIHLKFNFEGPDGNILNPPAGAAVSLSFAPHGGVGSYNGTQDTATHTYALEQNGDDWTYEWDSSVAAPCVVAVHAQTNGGPPTASIDSEFRLKANRANKELTGDW